MRPVVIIDEPEDLAIIGEELLLDFGPIWMSELRFDRQKFKRKKAFGIDDVPGEFW